ncbi:uncharacterized protein AKAW2_60397A [Aspergillus luchuensis]|uniref:Uncharacterized protein n=1 Tax=Aspergillus kawachii TaxID=1069201 RepID=A0A7R7WFP6_ASPKA|nr:uncharacterized protein AKAW2_60397A [Aspergillus luchuensis]BCS02133.1 hypothetical protein AKAW2_60397A [Aspergillus luchuensis]
MWKGQKVATAKKRHIRHSRAVLLPAVHKVLHKVIIFIDPWVKTYVHGRPTSEILCPLCAECLCLLPGFYTEFCTSCPVTVLAEIFTIAFAAIHLNRDIMVC